MKGAALYIGISPRSGGTILEKPAEFDELDPHEKFHAVEITGSAVNALEIIQLISERLEEDSFWMLLQQISKAAFKLGQENSHL